MCQFCFSYLLENNQSRYFSLINGTSKYLIFKYSILYHLYHFKWWCSSGCFLTSIVSTWFLSKIQCSQMRICYVISLITFFEVNLRSIYSRIRWCGSDRFPAMMGISCSWVIVSRWQINFPLKLFHNINPRFISESWGEYDYQIISGWP